MKEKIEKLIDILISYKAYPTVLISKSIEIPSTLDMRRFVFIPKDINGVVFFIGGHPLSNKDVPIDDIFEFDEVCKKYMSKYTTTVITNAMGGDTYLVRYDSKPPCILK